MTEEIYRATKEFCGALAVSWYALYLDAQKVISECEKYDIKVNIHFLLSKQTIKEVIRLLYEETELLQQINAIIFLNYKPIHSTDGWCLMDDDNLQEFLDAVNQIKGCRIGFDSCMISYLTISKPKLMSETVEFCESARFSEFIAEDSFMYPCSFMCDTEWSGIDLTKMTLHHDSVFYPEDGVKYALAELWNQAEEGEVTFEELQIRLQQIADWISTVEKAVGEGQAEWVGYY